MLTFRNAHRSTSYTLPIKSFNGWSTYTSFGSLEFFMALSTIVQIDERIRNIATAGNSMYRTNEQNSRTGEEKKNHHVKDAYRTKAKTNQLSSPVTDSDKWPTLFRRLINILVIFLSSVRFSSGAFFFANTGRRGAPRGIASYRLYGNRFSIVSR